MILKKISAAGASGLAMRKRRRAACGPGRSPRPSSAWRYIATASDMRSQGLVPPNGFNCRGSLEPVTFDEAKRMGFIRKDETLDRAALARYNAARQRIIDRGDYPDPGFKR